LVVPHFVLRRRAHHEFMIAKLVLAGALTAAAMGLLQAPTADAVCGSIGGRHVDVSGCSDPLYELNDALQPPPPPPPVYVPPAPNVNVCASVGRRVSVSGCI
jgi:hypothetical protein